MKYVAALIGRHCHGHDRGRSGIKKMRVTVTVAMHPRTCIACMYVPACIAHVSVAVMTVSMHPSVAVA